MLPKMTTRSGRKSGEAGGVQLTLAGKLFIVLVGLSVLGFVAWRWRHLIAPPRPDAGNIPAGSFSFAGGPAGATLGRPLRVGINTWGGYAGGIMANKGFAPNPESIFMKKFGIMVELVLIDDFVQSRDAFRAGGDKGGIDVLWDTVDSFGLEEPELTKSGLNPIAFMPWDWSRGGDAMAVGPGIKTAADLKGRKIACAEGTPSHFLGLFILNRAGLQSNDVQWVWTTSAIEAANIFKAGKADACVSWAPDVFNAAEAVAGGHILASTKDATNLIADIFVARKDFLEAHRQELAALAAGWYLGVEEVKKDPDAAARLMASSFTGITLDDAKGMLDSVHLMDYAEATRFFALGGPKMPTDYDAILRSAQGIWRNLGMISTISQPASTRDNTTLEAIATHFPGAAAAAPTDQFAFSDAAPVTGPKAEEILTQQISIYFASGSATLDPNALHILDQEAATLAGTFGSSYIRVEGNTDNVGAADMNRTLSERRARAVVDYLVQNHNFPRDRFRIVGRGPDNPVASNETVDGKQKNRRTDFVVVRGQ
jgi:NitT/TauT family transport system substrate-binding protein